MTENLISVNQISSFMKQVVSLSKIIDINEETLNTIIDKTNLLVDPAIDYENIKMKKNEKIDCHDQRELLNSIFCALSECTILDTISEFVPKDQTKEDSSSTQEQNEYLTEFPHKQVSKEVRKLIASVVFLIQLDGSINFEDGKTSGHNKLTMKYLMENISNPNKFSFLHYLQQKFPKAGDGLIDKLPSHKISEIDFGLGANERTLRNWVYVELPIHFQELLFTAINTSKAKYARRTEKNSEDEGIEVTDIFNDLEKPINDYPHLINFDFQKCINLDGRIVTFDELTQFSGSALLVAPVKGGKTHLLKLLANFSNKFIYINLVDMSIAKEFDIVRFLASKLVLHNNAGKIQKVPNISLEILRNYIILFDNFDELPTTEQMAVIYQLSIVPNTICGTSFSYPPLFFSRHQVLQKSLNPVVYSISPSAGNLSSIFRKHDLSNQEMARIETLSFSSYPGGLDYISQYVEKSFSELITGFCDFSISHRVSKILRKELKLLQLMVSKMISNELGIQLFSQMFYSYVHNKDSEIYKKFDLLLKDFFIKLEHEEEEQLLDSSDAMLLRKIIRISDHKLRFQYHEFLWVLIVDFLDPFSDGENFRAVQLGNKLSRNSAWAFFYDFLSHRQY